MNIVVATDADFKDELHSRELANSIGSTLALTYPGYRWRVEPQPTQGIVDVRCETASGNAGYTFKLSNGIPDKDAVIRAGGEILERFKLNRRGFDEAEFHALPRFLGRLLPEW